MHEMPKEELLHTFYILEKSIFLNKYIGITKPKYVLRGTMIYVQLIINEKEAYINIVDDSSVSETDIWICELSCLIRVNKKIFQLIRAVPSLDKRLELIKNNSSRISFPFEIGNHVVVNLNPKKPKKMYTAIIQYIGEIPNKGPGIFFGLELLGDEIEGYTDGKFHKTPYFKCRRDRGVFVTIDQIKPTEKDKMSKSNYSTNSSNSKFYSMDDDYNSQDNVKRTDKNQSSTDKKGKTHHLANDSSTQVSENELKKLYDFDVIANENSTISDVPKRKYRNETLSPVTDNGSNESEENGYELTRDIVVGSAVEINLKGKPHFGVVRWIGQINGERKVGIEMDKEEPDFTNGTYDNHRYFTCEPNTALFVNINKCRLDSRLSEGVMFESRHNEDNNKESPVVIGFIPPLKDGGGPSVSGKYKGIQGHHNSCYLDATLFSMFTFTSVFDSLLYRPASSSDIDHYEEVQSVLRDEIVNPLRKNNFVSANRVMKLRRLMEKLSSVSGLTTEEKDPEEFLTSLVAQILKADPFLKLNSGQEAFHYQLFVEKNEKLALPSVQQLFELSFYSSDIKLKQVPPCLIIQMPRFGKSYKMYPRILPSQLLDVTDVIENSPRHCIVCGSLAKYECRNCFDGLTTNPDHNLQNTALCDVCVSKVHNHNKRTNHKWKRISVPSFIGPNQFTPRLYMELFAVVCIETSHYVTFVKCGEGAEAPWCFFDSMADREGEQDGFNIPAVVMCPDLPTWLSEKGALKLQQFKDGQLPEHAKRLLCDAYMCMYQSPEVMMYR